MSENFWNISRLADEFGLDRRTVKKRLAGIEPAGNAHGGVAGYRLRDVAHLLVADRIEVDDGETSEELRRRKLKAQARLAEIEVEREEGRLVAREDVDAAAQHFIATTRQRLLGVPAKVAPLVAAQSEPAICQEIVRREQYDALAELSRLGEAQAPNGNADAG